MNELREPGGLRVLYVSPDFAALDPLEAAPDPDAGQFSSPVARSRASQGAYQSAGAGT